MVVVYSHYSIWGGDANVSTPGQYGGLRYDSPTERALSTITDEDYQKVYSDQAALTSKLVNDVSFIAANLRKVQSQADQADENVIQQLQDFINDIEVIMGGQGDTGFDFGDFKYVLEAYGALFDFIGPDGNIQTPVNLEQAMTNFFDQYLFGGQNWQQQFDSQTDTEIATMLDILGEVPILNQAAQQLAMIISKNRDNTDTMANVFNTFFQAFNIAPGGSFDLADFFNATNGLYTGLESLYSDVNFGTFQPIFEQMSRWDQQVMDAIYKLSVGDLSGIIGLFPISQLTNFLNLQPESDFADSDSIAPSTTGISWDGTVGKTQLGSAKFICDGTTKGMNGYPVAVDETQTLSPSVWVKWAGVTSSGNCVQLYIRASNGVDYLIAQTALSGSSGGWIELSGTWTDAPLSDITHGRIRFVVTSGATAGNIWFDDSQNAVGGALIPQDWVDSLEADLGANATQIATLQDDVNARTDAYTTFMNSFNTAITDGSFTELEDAWITYNTAVTDITDTDFATWDQILDTLFGISSSWNALLASFGYDSNGDYIGASTTDIWTNWWNEVMVDLGLVAPASTLDWVNLLVQYETILWDLFHTYYPVGSPTDTPTTTISGRPTWWSAANGLSVLLGLTQSTTGPAVSAAAVGDRIVTNETAHQALADAVNQGVTPTNPTGATAPAVNNAVAQLTQAVSGLQSSVVNLQSAANNPTTILRDTGQGSPGTGVGSKGTVRSGDPTLVNRDASYGFVWGATNSTTQLEVAIYNTPLATNDQVGIIILNVLMSYWPADFWGGTYYQYCAAENWIILRADSLTNPQNFIFARVRYDDVQFGYCHSGTVTMLGSPTTFKASAASQYAFQAGDASSDYNFKLTSGGSVVATYADSAHATSFAIGNLYSGQAWKAVLSPAGGNAAAPASTSWESYDAVASAGVPPGYAHINRTTAPTTTVTASGGVLPYTFMNNIVALGSNMSLPTSGNVGIIVGEAGVYAAGAGVRQSSTPNATDLLLALTVNGTVIEEGNYLMYDGGGTILDGVQWQCTSPGLLCNAGDIIGFKILDQSDTGAGSTWVGSTNGAHSYLKAVKVA